MNATHRQELVSGCKCRPHLHSLRRVCRPEQLNRRAHRQRRSSSKLAVKVQSFKNTASEEWLPAASSSASAPPTAVPFTKSLADVVPGSSDSATDAFYGDSEAAPGKAGQLEPAEDPVIAEIKACEELEDIIEMVQEEADLKDGTLIVAALSRCVKIAKRKAGQPGKQARRELARIGRSDALATLLRWVQHTANSMDGKELARCLWALASMNVKVVRVLRSLQKEVEARLPEMNPIDLAQAAWAFGTLKHHPGALLDLFANAAAQKLDQFEPQGLSMMMWAFAKLDHTPSPKFSDGVLARFNNSLEEFSAQSVANIMYAAGKLHCFPRPTLSQRVEELVAADPSRFKDIELANILYGYVKSKYQPQRLTDIMQDRVAQRKLEEQTLSVAWATLVWGAGALGVPLRPETLAALDDWGLQDTASYEPLSLCNMAWGLAMLGEVSHPAFDRTIQAIVECHRQRTLEPRLMRQLFQAVTSARLLGQPIQIPTDLETTAHKWWRKAMGAPMGLSHASVVRAARKLGLQVQAQVSAGYGLPIVDLALQRADGRKVAVQVQSPLEYATNGDRKPLGRIVSSKRLLEAAGWEVYVLNAGQMPSFASEPAMLGTVGRFLHSIGFTTDWKATAASAPRPLPHALMSDGAREAAKLPPVVGLQPRKKTQKLPSRQLDSAAVPVNGHQQGSKPQPSAQGTAARPQNQNGAPVTHAPAETSLSVSESSAAGDAPRQAAPPASMRAATAANAAAAAVNSEDKIDDALSSRQQAVSVGLTAEQVQLRSPEEHQKRLEPSKDDELTPEERAEREAEQQARKEEVARQLSGDFMEGWVNLAEWKSLRKVVPGRN